MALDAGEMVERARNWAQARGVTLHPGCEQILHSTFMNDAEPRIQARLAAGDPPGSVSREVDAQIDRLLEEILQSSPIKELHEAATYQALAKLCPGFWPFC